jgi:hypothetical protein
MIKKRGILLIIILFSLFSSNVFALDPEGKPSSFSNPYGIYIWQDIDDYEWHIWTTYAPRNFSDNYKGTVITPIDGVVTQASYYSSDWPGETITWDANRITVDEMRVNGRGGIDGVDFKTTASKVKFDVKFTGTISPSNIFIGSAKQNPSSLSFSLISRSERSITNLNTHSLKFDGLNDYLEIPHSDAYLLNEGTIEFWFKANDVTTTQGIFSKDSNGYDTGGHLSISIDGATSKLRVRLQSVKASYNLFSDKPISANTWYHVAFTFGRDGMKLYINGEAPLTNTYTGGLGTTSGGKGNFEPIAIGAATWRSDDLVATPIKAPFNGLIDEVRIWNFAKSINEILRDKDTHLTGSENGLVGYLRFNDGSGQIARDRIKANNGILGSSSGIDSNDPSWSTSVPFVVSVVPKQTFSVLKTLTPPIIDGNISEFAQANSIQLTNSRGTTGTYKLLWDDTAL